MKKHLINFMKQIYIVKQIRDMGVNLAIDGGKSETIYENDLLLDFFDKP